MKNKLINLNPAWFTRPGIVAAAAIVCGYWTSQILATWYIGDAEAAGQPSWSVAALCFGAFVVLFLAHLLRPWSKTAAIFGLCSLAAFVGLMWYDSSPVVSLEMERYIPSGTSVILISTVFGVAGMAADATRCWRVFRIHHQGKNLPADFAI